VDVTQMVDMSDIFFATEEDEDGGYMYKDELSLGEFMDAMVQLRGTNAATVKDAEDAQNALAQALVVLREFYAKAAEATAMVQQQAHQSWRLERPPCHCSLVLQQCQYLPQ